jgi:ADP-heptose:LPS heptosyltransferase
MMMGGKFTAGFIRDVDPPGHLDFAHVLPESLHEVDRLLSLSAALGARRLGRHTEFHLSEEDRGQAARFLADVPRPLIGIQPGARYAIRRWSPEKFAGTSKILQAATAGTVVILGGPEEDRIGAWLAGELNGPCLNLTGTIPVPILGALIERLDVLLTNDSGPAHIAYALDRPTIVVWGGAVLAHWGPPEIKEHIRVICRDVPCRPCWRAHCPLGYHCLEEIHAEEVAAAALGVLAAGKRGDYGCTPYADIQLASFLHKTRENI